MTYMPELNRRSFVVGAAAVTGGLAVGLDLPFGGPKSAMAAGGAEVTAWVVIQPDETVVIRIARSEMGQGHADRPRAACRRKNWNATGRKS